MMASSSSFDAVESRAPQSLVSAGWRLARRALGSLLPGLRCHILIDAHHGDASLHRAHAGTQIAAHALGLIDARNACQRSRVRPVRESCLALLARHRRFRNRAQAFGLLL